MRRVKLFFDGRGGLGHAFTTAGSGLTIRIEELDIYDLATLAADIIGECQPYLHPHYQRNLADWLRWYGAERWGKHRFLWEVARALIWQSAERCDMSLLYEATRDGAVV